MLKDLIRSYIPRGEQEEFDRARMLACIDSFDDVLTRDNSVCHFTASSWICDEDCRHVLMIYHNIYDSWAWTGGHADGCGDLASVALREALEETGLKNARIVSDIPISIEVLPVKAHFKRGKYVGGHLHLNVTYLLMADKDAPLSVREGENSAVRWMTPEEAVDMCSEDDMKPIYAKLNERMKAFAAAHDF